MKKKIQQICKNQVKSNEKGKKTKARKMLSNGNIPLVFLVDSNYSTIDGQ